MRGDQAASADDRTVEDGAVVGQDGLSTDMCAVHHASVRDRGTRSDVDLDARRGMQDAESCTLAPSRTTIGAKSPLSTALNQTDAPASTCTSPTKVAVGAIKALGSTVGDRPSNEYNGIV